MSKKVVLFGVFFILAACSEIQQEVVVIDDPVVDKLEESNIVYPISNFETGIIYKPFGFYVIPATSPVQPERFSGYHTGADIEAAEGLDDVWVYAIADGEILSLRDVDGYGGIIQIKYEINDEIYTALYGHLDINSALVAVGNEISAGDQLAILGDAYSSETDGERKHLHFSLKPGLDYDLRGYVENEQTLEEWIDPEEFIRRD